MSEEQKYGVAETKEMLKFLVLLGMAVDKSLEDKKLDLADAPNLLPAMLAAGPAFSNVSLVPKELGELDAAEKQELVEYFAKEFDLKDDKIEMLVEKGLKLGLLVYEFVVELKGSKSEAQPA